MTYEEFQRLTGQEFPVLIVETGRGSAFKQTPEAKRFQAEVERLLPGPELPSDGRAREIFDAHVAVGFDLGVSMRKQVEAALLSAFVRTEP